MTTPCVIAVDLAAVYDRATATGRTLITTLAWGDFVDVIAITATHLKVEAFQYVTHDDGSILWTKVEAFIVPPKSARKADGTKLTPADVVIPRSASTVLKVNFVDVQQGDGAVIETPDGKVILVDGGDNQLFARYLASRYRETSLAQPLDVDCMLVTHGDADHFSGLVDILDSETNGEPRKRLFLRPHRVYHNGIVKRPTTRPDGSDTPEKALLGPTKVVSGTTLLVGLEENLLAVPDTEMNREFKQWKQALATWHQRSPITFRRLSFGDDAAFDFFRTADRDIAVLGPIPVKKGTTTGLPFLGTPPDGPRIGQDSLDLGTTRFTGASASHTINGHSIVLRLRYGNVRYLLAGDLNDEASRTLAQRHEAGTISLTSEVLKVPHHGSADFSAALLQRVSPVVSVVSSGDESARKEYIHPRATLLGALGRYSRVAEPLVFVTELAAFFMVEGWSRLTDAAKAKKRGSFFAFSRAAYGMVKTRTDGRRLLVYTDSGKQDLKEAYAVTIDAAGVATPSPVVKV